MVHSATVEREVLVEIPGSGKVVLGLLPVCCITLAATKFGQANILGHTLENSVMGSPVSKSARRTIYSVYASGHPQ